MIARTALAAAFLLALAASPGAAQRPAAQAIAAAVANPARPAEDRARDAERKPAEMLAFAGVRPGMTVIDLMPGTGYFTRLFADAVGPDGKVVAFVPDEYGNPARSIDRVGPAAAAHANVLVQHDPILAPEPENVADLVWTAQNYHDLHNIAGLDLVAVNRRILRQLKPGGVYVVLDHAAAAGAGLAHTRDLHRIDPAAVRAEVVAAGFLFDGESGVLANPADPHDVPVFDAALRGRTDQFVYRFRKPGGARR